MLNQFNLPLRHATLSGVLIHTKNVSGFKTDPTLQVSFDNRGFYPSTYAAGNPPRIEYDNAVTSGENIHYYAIDRNCYRAKLEFLYAPADANQCEILGFKALWDLNAGIE
jgi:hypothetical protein